MKKHGRKTNVVKQKETMDAIESVLGAGSVVSRAKMIDTLVSKGFGYKDSVLRVAFIITDKERRMGKNAYKLGTVGEAQIQPAQPNEKEEFKILSKTEVAGLDFSQRMAYYRKLRYKELKKPKAETLSEESNSFLTTDAEDVRKSVGA